MKNIVEKFINQIKSNTRLIYYDETQTKQAIILPLLQYLGWNPFDVEEVAPEFPVENRRIDFALRINNENKVFIEVKKTSEDLENHQKQLLDYSFLSGVALAVLTNGITWWFYLPTQQCDWYQRKFYAIDINQQDLSDIASKFIDFLNKENVSNGCAFSNALNLFQSRRKEELLNKTLPVAWNKIITEPDKSLCELLIETTEKICGFKPDEAFVTDFLKNKLNITHTTNYQKEYQSQKQSTKIQPDHYIDDKNQRELGRKGYDQIEHYIIPVISLIKSGKEHTEVFHEISKKLRVRYQTVSAQCTRQLKISTIEFLELIKNGQIINLLEKKYPEKREIIIKD